MNVKNVVKNLGVPVTFGYMKKKKKTHVRENYECNIVVKTSFFTQPFEDS